VKTKVWDKVNKKEDKMARYNNPKTGKTVEAKNSKEAKKPVKTATKKTKEPS